MSLPHQIGSVFPGWMGHKLPLTPPPDPVDTPRLWEEGSTEPSLVLRTNIGLSFLFNVISLFFNL